MLDHFGVAKREEPLIPLLASHDEQLLVRFMNDMEPEDILAKFINDVEPKDIILSGSSPQPTVFVSPTEVASTPPAPQVVPGDDGGWKEELMAKWGYLGGLGSVSVRRLGDVESTTATSTVTVVSTPGTATPATAPHEIVKEDRELTDILERLNCAASDGRVFSTPSASLQPAISKFTEILKDTVNGVPTAYDDLVSLFDSSFSIFEMAFEEFPSSLKELITNLPDFLTPEVLTSIATISPALADAGKKILELRALVTSPEAIIGMLKAVVNALKLRFPMLLSGSVAVGLSMFIVLFTLWYCYKRGKETREEREEKERMEKFGVEKIKSEKELAKEKTKTEKELAKEKIKTEKELAKEKKDKEKEARKKEKETKKAKEKEGGEKEGWSFF